MCARTVSRLAVGIVFLGAVAFAASPAKAASDFTLGPATLTVGVESDASADGGCMNGTTNDGCDSYKFKVPLTVDPNNDIVSDLGNGFLLVGISTGQFCNVGNPDFGLKLPNFITKQTKSEDTLKFNGMAEAETATESAMVPVKVLIKVNRHTLKGFFMASGLGDLTPLHGGSSAFVGLQIASGSEGDSDTDFACTSVTQKNTNQK